MDICRKASASAGNGGRLHVASSFPATADEPAATSSQDAQPPIAAEPVPPQPATEKKYRLPTGQKLHKRTTERVAERRQPVEARGSGMRGAEPVAAEPLPVPPVPVPVEGAPPVPQPPEGEDEVLPDRELNLDGIAPPPLVKLHRRLAKRSELLKLHLKHYCMSSAQFRRRTSELYLPEGVYRL